MTIMLAKTYAALKAAGVSDEQAQAAAEELGNQNDNFGELRHAMHEMHADMKSELSGLRSDLRGEVAGVRSEVAYLRGRFDVLIWAVGINAAATIAILGVLLRH
jgi:hypothetical protein